MTMLVSGEPSAVEARAVQCAVPHAGERALLVARRRILQGHLVAIGLLCSLHALVTWPAAGTYHPLIVRLFDVDYEMNLPTWFASVQWLAVSLAFASIALATRWLAGRRRLAAFWGICAFGAMYLSADEVAVLHERAGALLEDAVRLTAPGSVWRSLLGFQGYYWVVAYLPLAVPGAIAVAVLLWRELREARGLAFLGMFVFVYAAVGLDFIEGHYGAGKGATALPLSVAGRTFQLDIFLIEEGLEMLGLALFLHALLRHLITLVTPTLDRVQLWPTREDHGP